MRVDHVLDRVRDDIPRWQAIEHAVVTHSNAIIDRDGIKFLGNAPRSFDFTRDQLPKIFQVDMPWYKLGE